MERIAVFLWVVCISSIGLLGGKESVVDALRKNPGTYLNPQDVPIFYQGNPLEGLTAFAVIPPYSIEDAKVKQRIMGTIEQELGSIGAVVKEKAKNVTGFGTGNLLHIQIGPLVTWDGGKLPITRVTLSVETPVVISKTNVKSLPRVWTINNFVDAPIDSKFEEKIVAAMRNLLKEFRENYSFVNPPQSQKPIFYIY